MEEQFVLRLPESLRAEVEAELRDAGRPSGALEVREDGQLFFRHRGRRYEAVAVRLPGIVESFKTFDGKQFCKTADVAVVVVVKEAGEVLDVRVAETSGLSPPMKFARLRRFRVPRVLQDASEAVEKRVRELLDKELQAVETTILYRNTAVEEEEVEHIAEEIAASLGAGRPAAAVAAAPQPAAAEGDAVAEIDAKIARLEEAAAIAVNPILRRRFEDALAELRGRREKRGEGGGP